MLGKISPLSHLDTVELLTPKSSPSWVVVRLFSNLNSFNLSQKVFIITILYAKTHTTCGFVRKRRNAKLI